MQLITYKQAAELFPNKTKDTIAQWFFYGKLPKSLRIKIGGNSFIDKDALIEYLETQRG